MSQKPRTARQENAEFSEQVDKWGTFLIANLLWAICAIPILTLPASTAGLFAVMSSWARGKRPEVFTSFFAGMRTYWLKAMWIALLDLAIAALLVVNLSIFPLMDSLDPLAFLSRSMTLFVAAALAMVNLYLWSLLVILDVPFKQLIKSSISLAFTYPLWSFGVLLLALLPPGISLLLPQGFFAFVTVSGSVLIVTMGTWRVIRRHLSAEDLKALEAVHRQTAHKLKDSAL